MSRTSEAPASQEPLSSKRKMPWSLTFVLLAVCLVDGILTLVGQSRLYWANHIFENEFDPLFAWFLEVSPHLFVWALLALAALLVFAMRLLPLRFSLPVWLLFFVGHAASAASWMPVVVRPVLWRWWWSDVSRIAASYTAYLFLIAASAVAAIVAYREVRKRADGISEPDFWRDPRRGIPCLAGTGILALVLVTMPIVLGRVTIFEAVEAGNYDRVAQMVEESPSLLSETDRQGCAPLHLAAQKRDRTMIDLLIEHGADLNARPFGRTPLGEAFVNGDRSTVVWMLLRHNPDVTIPDEGGSTPLHHAARGSPGNDAWLVNRLIVLGADVNAADRHGRTPLHAAAMQQRADLAAILLEHGADPDLPGGRGRTPLRLAAQTDDVPLAELLLRHSATVDLSTGSDGMTALHEAARFGRPGVAKLLLRSGAEVDARDGEGRTPLHLAAATKHVVAGRDYPGVVSLLLESGADADAEDGAGKTPLMLAEEAGHTRVVELLRRDGPDM